MRCSKHAGSEAARAITRFNTLFVDAVNLTSGLAVHRTNELASILREILGPASSEVRLLTMTGIGVPANDAAIFSLYGGKSVEFASRPLALANGLSPDCANLEAAVALTALLGLPTFLAIERRQKTAETRTQCSNLT
jgi:hypothetical protein